MALKIKMTLAGGGCLALALGAAWAGSLALGGAGGWVVGLATGLGLGYLVVSHYLRPLPIVRQIANDLLKGDLSVRADIYSLSGEWLEIADALNRSAEQQRAALRIMAAERDQMLAVLGSMSEGLIATDQVGRIMMVNRAAEEMLEIQAAQVRGRPILEAIRHHELEAAVKKVLENAAIVTAEIPLFPSRRQLYRLQLSPICQPSGRVVGAVIMVQDVTELRQLEKMRTEFVANISHELRTPLTSIKGFVETLLESAVDDPAVSHRFLEIIRAETERLQRLVEDVFTLSRLESRRIEVSGEEAGVLEAVRGAFELLAAQAKAKEIELGHNIPADLPAVRMSRDFLSQVLVNLVDNAIKYNRVGGRVEVAARAESHHVQVEVRDTGKGIPREDQPRIFERFYRVDKGRARSEGGTGLGLAIVKHIIETHGGQIRVVSEPSQGSSFTFTVPTNVLTHF